MSEPVSSAAGPGRATAAFVGVTLAVVLLVTGRDFLMPLVLAIFFWQLIRGLKLAFPPSLPASATTP
ncbi:MAG: hypothetical protein V3T72_18015 [Thermoanaerobaculia bacterium]